MTFSSFSLYCSYAELGGWDLNRKIQTTSQSFVRSEFPTPLFPFLAVGKVVRYLLRTILNSKVRKRVWKGVMPPTAPAFPPSGRRSGRSSGRTAGSRRQQSLTRNEGEALGPTSCLLPFRCFLQHLSSRSLQWQRRCSKASCSHVCVTGCGTHGLSGAYVLISKYFKYSTLCIQDILLALSG